jgi:hypothetical protein
LLSDFCEDEGLSDLSANAGFAIVAVDIRAAATTTTITGIVIVLFFAYNSSFSPFTRSKNLIKRLLNYINLPSQLTALIPYLKEYLTIDSARILVI